MKILERDKKNRERFKNIGGNRLGFLNIQQDESKLNTRIQMLDGLLQNKPN